jgi:aminopeptidase N
VTVGGPGVEARKLVLGATPARLRFAGCAQALKVNLGENGYYRTRYDAASLSALGRAFARLDATDRADLLGDQFALFEAGQAPLASYLDLIAGLPAEHERSIAVWQDTLSHLQRLDELERGSASRPAFRAFARSLLDPEMARLGWTPRPGEGFLDTLLRPDLITALGTFDDPAVTAEAQRRFAAYREQPGSLPPSLLDPVIRIVGMHADATTYTTLAGLVRSAPDTEQKQRFFTALAASHDPALMARSVRIAYSGAIPNGRIVYDLERIASYSDDPDAVWRLVQPNQAPIRTHLAPWSQDQLLPAIASQSANPAIARVLLTDPASHASGGARIETAKAEDIIATNAEVRDRAQPAIASWLEAGAAER